MTTWRWGSSTRISPNTTTRDVRFTSRLATIEAETGYPVLDLPREQEYFIELRLVA